MLFDFAALPAANAYKLLVSTRPPITWGSCAAGRTGRQARVRWLCRPEFAQHAA